jgi:uncharacterized protein with HEPN domain
MSSKRADKDYLEDIHDALGQIQEYIQGYNFQQFVNDRKTQDAVVRNLEIMGEAAKHISAGLRRRHAEIPWKSLAGVRDRIVHDYFGINYEIIWQIATKELPELDANLRTILE